MLIEKRKNVSVMQFKKVNYFLSALSVCLFLILLSGNDAKAQTSRRSEDVSSKKKSVKKTGKKKFVLFNKKKKSPYKTADQLQEEYVARMKENSKRRDKEEKMADKPQYSNPLYFGHKKPPKKRKNGKKKFCKECGLTH